MDNNVSLYYHRLPCRWAKDSIVVMDEVIIAPPYEPENCKANASASYTLARVKKVVSWIHRTDMRYGQKNFHVKTFSFFFLPLHFSSTFAVDMYSLKGRDSVWPMDANRVASMSLKKENKNMPMFLRIELLFYSASLIMGWL